MTGAAGKIASHLVKIFCDKEYNIVLLCRKSSEFINPRIKLIIGDLLDADSYMAGLRGMDTVLHMAAITHTNRVKKYYDINSNATLKLVRMCKAAGVKRFIFVSSRAISEEGGDYSKSKLIAERHVQESGLDWVIIRLAEVYGINGKTGTDMILDIIKRIPFIPVIGNGEYKIAPVYISDVASFITNVIESPGAKSKIYNIAGPESFTYNKFIDKILHLKHLKRRKIHIPICIVHVIAVIMVFIFRDRFLAIDQIPRLLSDKSDDISLAMNEFGYNPVKLEDVINKNS